MAKKQNDPVLTALIIPPDMARVLYERVSPYLQKYHQEQANWSRMLHAKGPPLFGLKELMLSCYAQGLTDANEALIMQKQP